MPLLLAALALAASASGTPSETVTITGTSVAFDLVRIAGARSGVGSFRIGAREVTWDEYALYAESRRDEPVDGITRPSQPDVVNPRDPFPDGTVQTGRHPARSIGWHGAMAYCAWLSKRTGRRFRLPTEAEWERAAGDTPDLKRAWHAGNSGGHTHPVGTLAPNGRGVYDLFGNVWEWCLEPASAAGAGVVVRGGGWNTKAAELTGRARRRMPVAAWLESDPKRPLRAWWLTDAPFVGFRVVAPD
ncbi:MAG: SUMF1/EgtB/PvdO family nonheme iron enzyme, partial [bacterium]